MSVQRYLEGTAYIVYGPGPPTDTIINSHHDQDQPHGDCEHRHVKLHSQSHFWVVFRPDRDVERIDSHTEQPHHHDHHDHHDHHNKHNKQNSAFSSNSNNEEPRFFVLKGTPHPWGSYPSDMPPPHGCIPPHLYYHVTISEYGNDLSDHHCRYSKVPEAPDAPSTCLLERSVAGTEDDKNNDARPLNEWIIPFVHRIGDGKNDAGGLTSAYSLLQDLEDADDYGAFIEHKLQQPQFCDNTPSLYASTQVLISEQRTLQVLEENVFISSEMTKVPRVTLQRELQSLVEHHLKETTPAVSSQYQLPFCVLRSDLKLIVPVNKA